MIKDKGVEKTFRDLEVIFEEGDNGNELFRIKKGQINISKKMKGIMTQIAVLREGDFLGEMAIVENEPRSATAIAKGKTVIVVYTKDAFVESVKNNPELALSLLKIMSNRIRNIDNELTKLNTKGLLPKDEAQKIKRYTYANTY